MEFMPARPRQCHVQEEMYLRIDNVHDCLGKCRPADEARRRLWRRLPHAHARAIRIHIGRPNIERQGSLRHWYGGARYVIGQTTYISHGVRTWRGMQWLSRFLRLERKGRSCEPARAANIGQAIAIELARAGARVV